jgi:hypothetical protein
MFTLVSMSLMHLGVFKQIGKSVLIWQTSTDVALSDLADRLC